VGEEIGLTLNDAIDPPLSIPAVMFEMFILAHRPSRQDRVEVAHDEMENRPVVEPVVVGVWGATEQKRHLSSVACSDRCKTRAIVPKKAGSAFPTGHWRLQKLRQRPAVAVCSAKIAWAATRGDDASTNMLSKA
jgi:hypothetical protein